jgi:2',3'-cyclic-nucleotide 2'-phosphodiesterase (5'-nucleotidase family)
LHRATTPFDLVVGDIQNAFPLGDTVVMRTLPGQLLWQVLEQAVRAQPAPSPSFLQVAGLRVTYSLGGQPGSRVKTVTLEDSGEAVSQTAKTYPVLMTDFDSLGGDGYDVLANEPVPTPGRALVADVVADYIKAKSPIVPASSFKRIVAVP